MLIKRKTKVPQSPLFRDRVVTLSTVTGQDGSIWNFTAQFKNFYQAANTTLRLKHKQFEHKYAITCPAKQIKIELLRPYLDSHLRYLVDSADFSKLPGTYPLRPIPGTYKTQEQALNDAGADALLRDLATAASRKLDHLITRHTRFMLETATGIQSTSIHQELKALASGAGLPRTTDDSTIKALTTRLQILNHKDPQVASLALELLAAGQPYPEQPAPSAQDFIHAAQTALS